MALSSHVVLSGLNRIIMQSVYRRSGGW